jgi:lipoprotein-anchoring transpeptidase ErfK/SrfK
MGISAISPLRLRLRSLPAALRAQGLRSYLVIGLAVAGLLGSPAGSAAAAHRPTRVQATQELVVLLTAHGAHRAPRARSPQVLLVAPNRPITGEQTTLPVIARSIGPHGARWLLVMLPGRPNGWTGWIAQQGTRPLVTPWRIIVDLTARRVAVYRDGRMLRDFQAAIGKPSTPMPTGQFFVEETVLMAAGQPGGPFALALSARSTVLQEFEGGPGQTAIHGRENLGGALGSAVSFGCILLATPSIIWLAERAGPGTPVTIQDN